MARATVYRIRVRGQLGSEWSAWFEGLEVVVTSGGETTLTGPLPDQSALHGLLGRVRDLGIELVSIEALDLGEATHTNTEV